MVLLLLLVLLYVVLMVLLFVLSRYEALRAELASGSIGEVVQVICR